MPHFQLAWRYASRRLVNLIAVAAIAMALAVQIVAMAVLDGMLVDMEKRLRNLGGQVTIRVAGEPPGRRAFARAAEEIKKMPGVEAVTPLIQKVGFLESGGGAEYVWVQGIDLAAELAHSSLASHLLSYRPDPTNPTWGQENNLPGLFMGEQLARRLGAVPGGAVELFYADRGADGGFRQKSRKFAVTSLFRSGVFEKDGYGVYIPIEEAGKFYLADYPDAGQRAEILVAWLADPSRADALEAEMAETARLSLAESMGRELDIQSDTWQKRWSEMAQGMKHENNLMELVLFLNDGASGFCVFAIMVTLVSRRIRDVGLLRCLGVSRQGVMAIFLGVGLLLGTAGGALGIAAGAGLSGPLRYERVNGVPRLAAGGAAETPLAGLEKAADRRPRVDRYYEMITGQPLYPPRMFGLNGEAGLPLVIYPWKLALYFAAASLVSVLAAMYPAVWAACREPMSALREG
ncbi:MAG: ABC transporter permease [Planctomycetota bacterium]|jgi:lipoprotein-releasing system permease protein|nr:ABC transporter permease [Planctomycetota bacterium]